MILCEISQIDTKDIVQLVQFFIPLPYHIGELIIGKLRNTNIYVIMVKG